MTDRGESRVDNDEDALDDLEPLSEIPDPHASVLSYQEVRQLALDCEKKIFQLTQENTELMQRINTHQCSGPPATQEVAGGPQEPRARLESQVEELKAAVASLKEENTLLRKNEQRLMDMVGVQDRQRQEQESEEIKEMRAKVKEQADLLAKQKMVIATLRQQLEMVSKRK